MQNIPMVNAETYDEAPRLRAESGATVVNRVEVVSVKAQAMASSDMFQNGFSTTLLGSMTSLWLRARRLSLDT